MKNFMSKGKITKLTKVAIGTAIVFSLALPSSVFAWNSDNLKIGSTDKTAVKELQDKLNQCGYSLTIDGIFGTGTDTAVKNFQRSTTGLSVDGIVGPATKQAIDKYILARASKSNFVELPSSGTGYVVVNNTYGNDNFGKPKTIQALKDLGSKWAKENPNAPKVQINDISTKNGGWMAPHQSHQKGVNVDIRLIRNDGQLGNTTYTSSTYSRDLTRKLIKAIKATGSVSSILFNDPVLINEGLCSKYDGHDDHLHVTYNY